MRHTFDLYTQSDAARELGISPQRIAQLIAEKKLGTFSRFQKTYVTGISIRNYRDFCQNKRDRRGLKNVGI